MFRTAKWREYLGDEAVQGVVDSLGCIDGKYQLRAKSAVVHGLEVPFYDGVCLVRVWDRSWGFEAPVFYYVLRKYEMIRLDGSSAPFTELNMREQLRLEEEQVADYLRFFCSYVTGDGGEPFRVAESEKDLSAFRKAGGEALNEAAALVKPVQVQSVHGGREFLCEGYMEYDNTLYKVYFEVSRSGWVKMTDDEVLLDC